MLRIYFRNNRELLKRLCQIANECLLEYLRQVTHKPDGQNSSYDQVASAQSFRK
jgi:hypothetical protein